MRKFRFLIIKVTITSLFFIFFQLNFSNADLSLCKIENNKLWTKLDHGLGFPRPENRLPNKGTLNFKVLFAKSSGSTVANEKSAEDLYKKLQPEIVSSFYNQVSNGSVQKIQFEPHYSWIEFDKLESLKDAAGDEIKLVEAEWRTFVSKTLETADSQIDFTKSDGVIIILDPNSSYLRLGYGLTDEHIVDGKKISSVIILGRAYVQVGLRSPYLVIHELGHLFGLPDLYSYIDAFKTNQDSTDTVAYFSVMNKAAVGGIGYFGWERFILGWLDEPQIICHKAGEVVGNLVPLTKKNGLKIITVPISTSEVLVVENRTKEGIDKMIPNPGIIAYVVDSSIEGGKNPIKVLNNKKPIKIGSYLIYNNVKIEVLKKKGKNNVKVSVS
jgi:M6 family metalloprotease-like protein